MAKKRKAGKKRIAKKSCTRKASANSVWVKVGVGAAILAVLIIIGLVYNLAVVGKVIEMPSPAVDLTGKEAESLNLLKYNKMELKFDSSLGTVYNLILNITKDGERYYYELSKLDDKQKEMLAQGILSNEMRASEIYLDLDDKADLELNLEGTLLYVANLNFIQPQAADIEVFDSNYQKIANDILYAESNKDTVYYFNATSTTKPAVTALLDNEPVKLTATASGKDFVLSSFSLKSKAAKPQQLILRADVGGKIAEKKFIVANNNIIYQLDGEKMPAVSLSKSGEKYAVAYAFKKTQELQPVALLCGSMNVNDPSIKASVEQIISYDEGIEQWTSDAPSDLKTISVGKGYFFKLKKNAQLGLSFFCKDDKLPAANIPQLKVGWNLLGVGGYKPLSINELKMEPGREIVQVQEYYGNGEIKELYPGKVYWVKVE